MDRDKLHRVAEAFYTLGVALDLEEQAAELLGFHYVDGRLVGACLTKCPDCGRWTEEDHIFHFGDDTACDRCADPAESTEAFDDRVAAMMKGEF